MMVNAAPRVVSLRFQGLLYVNVFHRYLPRVKAVVDEFDSAQVGTGTRTLTLWCMALKLIPASFDF